MSTSNCSYQSLQRNVSKASSKSTDVLWPTTALGKLFHISIVTGKKGVTEGMLKKKCDTLRMSNPAFTFLYYRSVILIIDTLKLQL